MERYGLFKRLSDGAPLWVCAEENLNQAVSKTREMAQKTGLEHFAHDFRFGTTVAQAGTTKPQAGATNPSP